MVAQINEPNKRRFLPCLAVGLIVTLVVCLGIVSLLTIVVSERIRIETISMQPALYRGDYVIIATHVTNTIF